MPKLFRSRGSWSFVLAGVLVLSLLSSTALAHDIIYFKESSVTVDEGLQVNLRVERCCHGSGSATADWETRAGSAQPGTEFVQEAGQANFSGPITNETLTFRTVASDGVPEPVKMAHLEMSNPKGSPAPIITYPKRADVVILDVDGPSRVAFMHPEYTVYSNRDSVKLDIVRLGDKSSDESVDFEVVEGTAKRGEHYKVPNDTTVEIPAGKREATERISIPILRNFKEKDNTEFTVRIGDGTANPEAGPQEVTVEIRSLDIGDYLKPFTDFHIPKDGATYPLSSYKAKEAHVYSDDRNGSGVKVVKLAVRKQMDKGGCAWWTGSRWKRGRCELGKAQRQMNNLWSMSKKPRSQSASTFTIFRLPKLKPTQGTSVRNYRTISRATDFSRNVESYFRSGFNIRTFKIRK